MPLSIGTQAPDFTLYDQNKEQVSLSNLAGHNSLIVFIPFPFTGRCEGEGVDAVRTAIDLDRELGLVDHLPVSLVVLGQIYQCHGQPQIAIDLYNEALELAEELDEPQVLFPCYDGLATVHLDIDDMAEAERYMEKAQAVCERAGLDPDALVVLPFLC